MGAVGDAIGSAKNKVFGDADPTAADGNGDLSGGNLFARNAVKGVLAGAGNDLQQASNPATPPVNFASLMARKKPQLPGPAQAGGAAGSGIASALYGD